MLTAIFIVNIHRIVFDSLAINCPPLMMPIPHRQSVYVA